MNASGLRPIRFLAPVAGLGLLIASLAVGSIGSAAGELIQNGAFEEWAGSTPAGWSASGVVARVSSPSVSGQAASLADGATLSRTVPAQAGFHYTFGVAASALLGDSHAPENSFGQARAKSCVSNVKFGL